MSDKKPVLMLSPPTPLYLFTVVYDHSQGGQKYVKGQATISTQLGSIELCRVDSIKAYTFLSNRNYTR